MIGYQLQMDNDSDFSSIEMTWTPVTSNQTLIGILEGLWYFRVRARDNEGANSTWSNVESILVDIPPADTPGPTITDLHRSPAVPKTGQTIQVFASVNDSSSILDVTLYYRVNDGTWLTVVMTSSMNEEYVLHCLP